MHSVPGGDSALEDGAVPCRAIALWAQGWCVCKCVSEGEKSPGDDGSRDFHSNPAQDDCITHNGDGWGQRVEEIDTCVGICQFENKLE